MGAPELSNVLSEMNTHSASPNPRAQRTQHAPGGNIAAALGAPVSTTEMEHTYASLIQQYLQIMCVDNAIFLAERMVATCHSSPQSLYLLALCHHRDGKPQRALAVLETIRTDAFPIAKYLLAKCAMQLNHLDRAEEALLQQARRSYRQHKQENVQTDAISTMDDWIVQTSPCPVPNGAAGLYLLGCICRKSNRKKRAIQYFRLALKLDPLMWVCFEALCEMGADDVDPVAIFGVLPQNTENVPAMANTHLHVDTDTDMDIPSFQTNAAPLRPKALGTPGSRPSSAAPSSVHQTPTESKKLMDRIGFTEGSPSATPESAVPKASLFQTVRRPRGNTASSMAPSGLFQTPNLTPIPINDTSFAPYQGQEAGNEQPEQSSFVDASHPHTVRRAKQVAARLYYPTSPETPESAQGKGQAHMYLRGINRNPLFSDASKVSNTPLRRGGRMSVENASTARKPRALFMASENKADNARPTPTDTKYNDDMASKDFQPPPNPKLQKAEVHQQEDEEALLETQRAVENILQLLCTLGAGYHQLCQFRCKDALQLFHSLPHAQRNTGWVLHMEGKAYLEMSDYRNAQRSLERMQRVEPHRSKGLELLSTVFWQLKKDVELAYLAQKAVDFDRMSPEAWCIVGNCLSLQKEHETALVFFGRSLQLDPSFTYTHTLSGYEYMANEDFEKAVACFRSAIHVDDRHYNAWYGLGAIYHRQEKYDLAEYHFQRAVSINPQSSVLRCNLGMTQFANGKAYQALDTLGEAFRLDPHNPQARFQRASIYVALNRPQDALVELEKVRDAAPREATIHFAIGKVLKKLGRSEEAMRCFLTALDLDPKDSQLIKSAMEKLEQPDLEEEVADF